MVCVFVCIGVCIYRCMRVVCVCVWCVSVCGLCVCVYWCMYIQVNEGGVCM